MSTSTVANKQRVTTMQSPSGATYSLEQIGPMIAEAMLTKNVNNRRIRKARIESLARDMEGGDFRENGDSICFDTDGNLLDGQHRLSAIVTSGTTILCLIVRGLPAHAQDTMDDGSKRTMADTFGFHNVTHETLAAAIVRRVVMWENDVRSNAGGNYVPTKSELLDAWRTDPLLRSAVDAVVSMGRTQFPPSVVGLTWWLFSQISTEDCATFWYGLQTGANLQPGSPVLRLRDVMQRMAQQPGRVPETHHLAWVIKCWNLWRKDKVVSDNYRGFVLKPGERIQDPR